MASSIPAYLGQAGAITDIRNGHAEWNVNDNYCGIADQSLVAFQYQGTTTASFGQNGINTVGWGDVAAAGCPGAIACTGIWGGANITEADTRLNMNLGFSTQANPNGAYFDVWGVVGHETGHKAGLNDIADTTNTMTQSANLALALTFRRLGRGDANANNAKY